MTSFWIRVGLNPTRSGGGRNLVTHQPTLRRPYVRCYETIHRFFTFYKKTRSLGTCVQLSLLLLLEQKIRKIRRFYVGQASLIYSHCKQTIIQLFHFLSFFFKRLMVNSQLYKTQSSRPLVFNPDFTLNLIDKTVFDVKRLWTEQRFYRHSSAKKKKPQLLRSRERLRSSRYQTKLSEE